MKPHEALLAVLGVFAIGNIQALPKFDPKTNVITGWITQKLDHFSSSDTRTWKMVRT